MKWNENENERWNIEEWNEKRFWFYQEHLIPFHFVSCKDTSLGWQ